MRISQQVFFQSTTRCACFLRKWNQRADWPVEACSFRTLIQRLSSQRSTPRRRRCFIAPPIRTNKTEIRPGYVLSYRPVLIFQTGVANQVKKMNVVAMNLFLPREHQDARTRKICTNFKLHLRHEKIVKRRIFFLLFLPCGQVNHVMTRCHDAGHLGTFQTVMGRTT